jgi:gamma-glutamylcyclotransferase (GGCT)/AIG2-like uncharacterized protein YtfP
LSGARRLGPAKTPPAYYLVELSAFPALVAGGRVAVSGELYLVDAAALLAIDVKKEHPVLFQRRTITLADGEPAEAYLMTLEQVRGRRRLQSGDWRERFSARRSGIPESRWAEWARTRRR